MSLEGAGADAVAEWVRDHVDELVALRRHLHAHPELSGREIETTEVIVERLRAAGWDPHVLAGGTGVVCDVGHGPEPPSVAIRADIDGLAMDDEKDVPYRSRTPGVAHACGHDVHTTVVLGAGLALAARLTEHRVRLVFEPAEEQVPGGAVEVIEQGWLEGVRSIYGLHCDPKLDVGQVGTRAGPITSAADQVELWLTGPGGHTARPHLTVDMVSLAARLALQVPVAVAEAAPGEVSVVFGAVHAGDAPNVIPTTAHLAGTLRTPDPDTWRIAGHLFRAAAGELVEGTGAELQVLHRRGVPPVVNHERETALLRRASVEVVGEAGVVVTPRSAGGDSFAWYLEATGGTFARLGTHDPTDRDRLDLHHGSFDVHEDAIAVGVRVLAGSVLHDLT